MKERCKRIEFPVWSDYTVHLIVTNDFSKSVKKHLGDAEDSKASYRAITYHLGDDDDQDSKESFVFLSPDSTVSEIAHECWHVIYRMMNYFEAKLEDEVVAYHLGYLCQEAFDFVRRKA